MASENVNPAIPEQIKDLIGQIAVATAKSTAPDNKLSLTSSRISFDLGALYLISRARLPPGLFETLHTTLLQMIGSIKNDEKDDEIIKILNNLEEIINNKAANGKKAPSMIDSLELIRDYNTVVECRSRWMIANDTYITSPQAWSHSNKMLADIHDALTRIEVKYDLIIVPKNTNWDINEFMYRKPQKEETPEQQAG